MASRDLMDGYGDGYEARMRFRQADRDASEALPEAQPEEASEDLLSTAGGSGNMDEEEEDEEQEEEDEEQEEEDEEGDDELQALIRNELQARASLREEEYQSAERAMPQGVSGQGREEVELELEEEEEQAEGDEAVSGEEAEGEAEERDLGGELEKATREGTSSTSSAHGQPGPESPEEAQIKQNLEQKVVISAGIHASDDAAAKLIKLNLGSEADIQALILDAINSTLGIQKVFAGEVGDVRCVVAAIGDSVPRTRGRLTAIEDELAVMSKGTFVAGADVGDSPIRVRNAEDAMLKLKEQEQLANSKVDDPKGHDLIDGLLSEAMKKASRRLEKASCPGRFDLCIGELENIGKARDLRLDDSSEIYWTCSVGGRPRTVVQTAKILFGDPHSWDNLVGKSSLREGSLWEPSGFQFTLTEEEELQFTLCAKVDEWSPEFCLGEIRLPANDFFSKEQGGEYGLAVSRNGEETGATLYVKIGANTLKQSDRNLAAVKIQSAARRRAAVETRREMEAALSIENQDDRQENWNAANEIGSATGTFIASYHRREIEEERLRRERSRREKQGEAGQNNKAWRGGTNESQEREKSRQAAFFLEEEDVRAAVKMQALMRGKLSRNKSVPLRVARVQDVLDDIALIESATGKGSASADSNAKGIDVVNSELPYGNGLDWKAGGYRAFGDITTQGSQAKIGKAERKGQAMANFKSLLLHREQSFASAWRNLLDPKWQGKLAIHEFCEACRVIGYTGQIKAVWQDLDLDGRGLVSLAALDWNEACELGQFHAKIVKHFGNAAQAAHFWGLHGPRRLKVHEFTNLVMSNGFATSQDQAELLWKMLCCVPNGDVPGGCGFLGGCAKELKDYCCGITARELKWLDVVATELPNVTSYRVPPGDEDQLGTEPDALLKHVQPIFDHDTLFEYMYKQGMEHHSRRNKRMERPPSPKQKPTDPALFTRLHADKSDHEVRKKQAWDAAQAKAKEESTRHHPRKVLDPLVQERLMVVRQKGVSDVKCTAKDEHLWDLLKIDELMVVCDELAAKENFQWKSHGKTRNELIRLLELKTPPKVRHSVAARPVPEAASRLHADHAKRQEALQDLQQKKVARMKQQHTDGLICPIHGPATDNPDCSMCRRYSQLKGTPMESSDERRLLENAQSVVQKKIEYQESQFKDLLLEGYHKGLIAGRSHISARIALQDAYGQHSSSKSAVTSDRRWEMVTGRDRDRLIAEAITTYTARQEKDKARTLKAQQNHDNSASYFRLFAASNQQTYALEKELMRQEELREEQLNLLNVHRNRAPNAEIFDTLYENDDRTNTFSHEPKSARIRARDRSADRQREINAKNLEIKRIQDDIKSPMKKASRKASEFEWEAPGESLSASHIVCLWFKDMPWKPPLKFEEFLRNKIQDVRGNGRGAGAQMIQTYDMRCRFRRPGPDAIGITVELMGPKEKCQAVCQYLEVDKFVVCEQRLTKVWIKDGFSDPLGEIADFLMLKQPSLEAAWKQICPSASGVNAETFKKKMWDMRYFGDTNFAFNALVDVTTGTITTRSFLTVQDGIIYAPELRDSHNPSSELAKFSEVLFKRYANLDDAFGSFHRKGTGKLHNSEFRAGCKDIQFDGSAAAVFQELDTRGCGFLRNPQEWARLGEPDVRRVHRRSTYFAGESGNENAKSRNRVSMARGTVSRSSSAHGMHSAQSPGRRSMQNLSRPSARSPHLLEPESEPVAAASPGKQRGSRLSTAPLNASRPSSAPRPSSARPSTSRASFSPSKRR